MGATNRPERIVARASRDREEGVAIMERKWPRRCIPSHGRKLYEPRALALSAEEDPRAGRPDRVLGRGVEPSEGAGRPFRQPPRRALYPAMAAFGSGPRSGRSEPDGASREAGPGAVAGTLRAGGGRGGRAGRGDDPVL